MAAGAFYVYVAEISGIEVDTEILDQIVIGTDPAIVDTAGNAPAEPIVIADLAIDTRPPLAPDTTVADDIVYTRAPWGVGDDPVASKLEVAGKPGVVAVDTTVIAYSSDNMTSAAELGRAVATDTGFAVRLVGQDQVNVFLTAVDTAGNESQRAEVRDVEWVATSGFKRQGSDIENPHQFEGRPYLGIPLRSANATPSSGAGMASLDDGDTTLTQAAPLWVEHCIYDGALPDGNKPTSFAYDSWRGKVVSSAGQILEWDGIKWAKACGSGTGCVDPDQTGSHGIAFDSRRGVTVSFFAEGTEQESAETWEWDGSTWQLRCGGDTGCVGPRGRLYHRMVYDSVHNRTLLFGGAWYENACDCFHTMDDLWAWDGTQWTQLCGSGTSCSSPAGRFDFGMAFDETTGRSVLFGGDIGEYKVASIPNNDTWEWDGTQWASVCSASTVPACTRPTARISFGMAFDSTASRSYLFGGWTGARSDETWAWNSSAHTWTKVCGMGTSCTGPTARTNAAMAFDGVNRGILLGGGYDGANSDEVWLFRGGAWSKLAGGAVSCFGPSRRSYGSMVYDSVRQRAFSFGGSVGSNDNFLNDSWEWDGAGWSLVCPTATCTTSPTARSRGALAYHPGRQRALYFGGLVGPTPGTTTNETWEWSGATKVWTKVCPTATCTTTPTARVDTAMAYHAGRGRIVLVGGSAGADEIWELYWNTVSASWQWNQICLAGSCGTAPTGRSAHAMAYDSDRGRIVLYGGNSVTGDETWELGWNSLTSTWSWTKACAAGVCGPGRLYRPGMAYDAARRRTVLFGDVFGAEEADGTWEWDGSHWTKICGTGTACDGPPTTLGPVMTYDTAHQQIVKSGGSVGASSLNETWILHSGDLQPAQAAFFRFVYARLDATPTLLSITPTVYAGADGYATAGGCTADSGAELLAWHRGAWWSLATNDASTEAPALMSVTLTDPAVLGRLLIGPYQDLALAVRPVAVSGCASTPGTVAVDYADVKVKYRKP